MTNTHTRPPGSMRTFTVIWFGQLASILGSRITDFALGLWVLEQTGSITPFALTFLWTLLPMIILSPFAGVIVDRWNRRTVMLLSDTGAACGTLLVWILLSGGQLDVGYIYVIAFVKSALSVFQMPAYAAAIPSLVPHKHIGRANGMVQGSEAIALLLAPLIAGVLLSSIELRGVILVDLATFLVALITLLFVRIPTIHTTDANTRSESFRQALLNGWKYILARPGILSLILFFSFSNFLAGVLQVLVQPLILSFANVTALGFMLSLGSSGMLVGSILMGSWGGTKRRIHSVLGFHMVAVFAVILIGIRPSGVLITTGLFLVYFCMPIINASNRSILNTKVNISMQGRVFALTDMLAQVAMPIGYVLAGPAVDYLFAPLVQADGRFSELILFLVGTGTQREIGLVLILIGGIGVLLTIAGYMYRPLRSIDDLPDANLPSGEFPRPTPIPKQNAV